MSKFRLLATVLLVALCTGFYSCSKDDLFQKEQIEIIPEITIESGNNLDFATSTGEKELSFSTNVDWKITPDKASDSGDWCTVSPTSGKAGNNIVHIKVNENKGYDDRGASLILQAGKMTKTIAITQKQKDAIIISQKEYKLSFTATNIEVALNTNVDYKYEIDKECDWIEPSNTFSTRGLINNTLYFNIKENRTNEIRKSSIVFKNKNINESIQVIQKSDNSKMVVRLHAAGSLSQYISDDIKYEITDLTIKGEINDADIRIIRDIAGCKDYNDWTAGKLSHLNLLDAHIIRSPNLRFYYICPAGNYTIEKDNTIDEFMFHNCHSLVEVILPKDVKSVEANAFNCTPKEKSNLKKVILGDNIVYIGQCAFWDCVNLTNIYIPKGLKNIGSHAFYGCTSLAQIEIPNSVERINDGAFYRCINLTKINIPNSINKIWESTFQGCASLNSVNLPNTIEEIEPFAFNGCTSLTNIEIPNSVKRIKKSAFSSCKSLTEITIPNSVIGIEGYVFSNCSNLVQVNVPSDLLHIDEYAFNGCTSLAQIEIPNSVRLIKSFAFNGCTSLINIEIPNGVQEIGSHVFSDCFSLNQITIPSSVKYISSAAFSSCSSLTQINIKNVEFIGPSTFSNCTNLTFINMPTRISKIEEYTFSNCISLTEINIPASVKEIEEYAFSGLKNMRNIHVKGRHVPQISSNTFQDLNISKCIFHVPVGCASIYKESPYWEDFIIVEE